MTFSSSEHILLWASRLPKVGAARTRQIAYELYDTSTSLISEQDAWDFFEKIGHKSFDIQQAAQSSARVIDDCRKYDIQIHSLVSPAYPTQLLSIGDPPPLIFTKGNTKILTESHCIAVVGTRKASKSGRLWAARVSEILAAAGYTIVSGLALGIDAAAHKGAISGSGRTAAILAHGLDIVSPKSHSELAEFILNNDGLLLSEHPPKTPPRPPEFVRRNRLQSGLSDASILVESGEEGGSIHQAKFTIEQKRKLYVIDPPDRANWADFNFQGADLLVKQFGAISIKGKNDISRYFSLK